ncbi:hypothetical protein PINS_up007936 [Pythium insidiosum]|nr:hypothetical protein PINS_up007936 [Pythium insidiosum]
MMEPTSTTGKQPPVLSPRAAAAGAGTGAAAAAAPAAQGSARSFQVPKVLMDKADDITQRITATDIARINGYMRFANLVGALLLGITCFFRMFTVSSYSHFLVVIYLIFLALGLVFIENHEQFPSIAEKVKLNFGFMFTAMGKAAYILSIAFLSFSQGWIGSCLGAFFLLLALFNFFLIYRHPAYQAHMTGNTQNSQQQADVEAMPEVRYNQAPVQAAPATKAAHVVV